MYRMRHSTISRSGEVDISLIMQVLLGILGATLILFYGMKSLGLS